MRRDERERFDGLLDGVIDALPDGVRGLIEEAPVIVEDRPAPELLRELGLDPAVDSLCGLHTGTPLTERSHGDVPEHPEVIHLFREGIIDEAGGWSAGEPAVAREIRITLLHEIGHHFGLEEDDLAELGYD